MFTSINKTKGAINTDETKLKIEFVPLDSIKPYPRNAKLHPPEQIEQIKESIRRVGFRDPIGIWHGEIVEGHGRYLAAQELGMTEVPVIRLDDLTDEERRAYMLIHNQTTMNSGWDYALLETELDELDFDMSDFGFEVDDDTDLFGYMRDDTFTDFNSNPETFNFTIQLPIDLQDMANEYVKKNGKMKIVELVEQEVRENA